MNLRIHRIVNKTSAEGFGNRYCIWVQGCSIRCSGCANKGTWSFDGGQTLSVSSVIEDIFSTEGIEGVTFLGGEPFEQAYQLYLIAREVQKRGLSVITFTGFDYDYIKNRNNPDYKNLLDETDILIDGPFRIDMFDLSRPWIGSLNQNYIFLTDRYVYFKDKMNDIKNKFEVVVEKNGIVRVNGMGDYKALLKTLKSNGWWYCEE